MSRFPLRPVASPSNTFVAPEVRGTVGDNTLTQTAAALSQFNRNLSRYAEAAAREEIRLSEAEAQQIQLQRQFKSMDELKAAVQRGEIREDQNPWKMVFLKQLVAKEQIRTGLLGIEDEFSKADDDETVQVRASQDINALSAWADQRIAQYTQDLDPWSAAAISGAVSEWKANFLSQQQAKWERQRSVATELGLRREIAHQLEPIALASKFVGPLDERQSAIIAEARQNIQGLIETAGRVMTDPEAIRRSVMAAVNGVAVSARAPELIDKIMSEVSIGGKTLGDLALPGEIEEMRNAVDEAVARDYRQRRFMEETRRQEMSEALLHKFQQERANALKTGQLIDINTYAVDVAELPPEEQVRVQQIIDRIVADDLDRHVTASLVGADPAGKPVLTLVEHLIASNQPGAAAAARKILEWREFRLREQFPEITSLPVQKQIEDLLHDPAKTPAQKLDELTDMVLQRQVSRSDAERAQSIILSLGRVNRNSALQTLHRYKEETKNALLLEALNDPEFRAQAELAAALGQTPRLPPSKELEIESRVLAFDRAFEQLLASNPNPAYTDLDKAMAAVRDSIIPPRAEGDGPAAGRQEESEPDPIVQAEKLMRGRSREEQQKAFRALAEQHYGPANVASADEIVRRLRQRADKYQQWLDVHRSEAAIAARDNGEPMFRYVGPWISGPFMVVDPADVEAAARVQSLILRWMQELPAAPSEQNLQAALAFLESLPEPTFQHASTWQAIRNFVGLSNKK